MSIYIDPATGKMSTQKTGAFQTLIQDYTPGVIAPKVGGGMSPEELDAYTAADIAGGGKNQKTADERTIPDVLSSGEARTEDRDFDQELIEFEKLAEQERENLLEEYNLGTSDIESFYKGEKEKKEESFKKERATESAIAFRLGQTATPYGAERKKEQERERTEILLDLDREKQQKLAEARVLFKKGKTDIAKGLLEEVKALREEQNEIKKEARKEKIEDYNLMLKESKEKRDKAKHAREEDEATIEFAQENEDRIAESLGSLLVDLDENNEIVQPSYDDIVALANENGISPGILASEINARIDELKKIQRDDRKATLDERKQTEKEEQNKIQNEFEKSRLGLAWTKERRITEKEEDELNEEEQELENEIKKQQKKMAAGEVGWGEVYDYFAKLYPELLTILTSEEKQTYGDLFETRLDLLLGKKTFYQNDRL